MSQHRYLVVGTPNIDIESWSPIRLLGSYKTWDEAVNNVRAHHHNECWGQWLIIDTQNRNVFNEHCRDVNVKAYGYLER